MQLIIVILFQLLIALYLSSCWGKLEEYWHGISDIYWLFSSATLAAEKISIKAKSGAENYISIIRFGLIKSMFKAYLIGVSQ